uniref:Uncharacterized protein n=1 Tax=Erpetoichthys calabaricus TaxID=27687 RepID=A0A8C4T3B9_ERPCA
SLIKSKMVEGKILEMWMILKFSYFSCVVNTVSKLTKMCTLRLTKEKLFFMLTDKVANGGVSMWSELLQENFFDEFQIEELAPENLSEIVFLCVSIYLPPLKTVKNVLDRMRNLCHGLLKFIFKVLEANMNGEMNLKIDTDLVSVSTHFRDLGNPPFSKATIKKDIRELRDSWRGNIADKAKDDPKRCFQYFSNKKSSQGGGQVHQK